MKPRHAMTLVEVLAVVVILGMVAATLTVGFSGAFGRGKHELARTGIAQVAAKLELFRMDFDAYPAIGVGLAALTEPLASPSAPYYLPEDRLIDPWGRRYLFVAPGPDGHPYELLTLGADAEPGGEGENADISSVRLRRDRP